MNQLMEVARKEVITSKSLCRVLGVVTFIFLTAIGAFVRIPLAFTPVPITLQTFFVLLSGAVLGGRLGAASQVGYLVLGGMGLAIFTGAGGGMLHLMGPTGGYLVGFVAASWVVGKLIHRSNTARDKTNFPLILSSFIIGSLIIYLLGFLQLALVFGCSLKRALAMGVAPFILGDILKALLAASLYKGFQPRLKSIFM